MHRVDLLPVILHRSLPVAIVGFQLLCSGCTSHPTTAIGVDALQCQIAMASAGIVLGTDSLITLDGPGRQFARDSHGNIYSASLAGGRILQWSANGTLLRTIGQPGQGPGELARGAATVYVTSGDTLYIRDNTQRWIVFDPRLRFVRTAVLGPMLGSEPEATLFLGAHTVISSMNFRPFGAMLLDREGNVLRQMAATNSTHQVTLMRALAPATTTGTFWIGPEAGPKAGYVFERWDTAGVILQRITRDVSWFAPHPDFSNVHDDDVLFPYPTLEAITVDSQQKLWIRTIVPTRSNAAVAYRAALNEFRGKPITPASMSTLRLALGRILDYRLDVFDEVSGRLLASSRFSTGDDAFASQLPSSRTAIRFKDDSNGVTRVTLSPLVLRDTSGAECNTRPKVQAP